MESLDLARWQFAATTIYHFMFVPITLGLSMFVAYMHTKWYRTRNPVYMRMARFWGKLLLINFAIGVVTGIVQEFQFGMAWSGYSRYVGDVFGAPLAIEGLVAFFLESTFLGLWMFGWDRLPKKLHLASIWLFAIGTWASAYFILAANSFMQHPVGYRINEEAGRAELTSIWELLTNNTALYAFGHVILGSIATAGTIMLGISAWHLHRERRKGLSNDEAFAQDAADLEAAATGTAKEITPELRRSVFLKSARLGLIAMAVGSIATMTVGHFNAQLMTKQQPMKMAAAEALWETTDRASFSLLTLAPFEKNPGEADFEVAIPGLSSFLATNSFSGEVQGINELQAQAEQKYGPGQYYPVIWMTYWSFRLMMGAGIFMATLALAGLLFWKRRIFEQRWFRNLGLLSIAAGLGAHSFGWIFAEIGRQPWVVYGIKLTSDSVSQLAASTLWTSLTVFVLLYGVLAVIAVRLFVDYAKKGPEPDHVDDNGEAQLAIQY